MWIRSEIQPSIGQNVIIAFISVAGVGLVCRENGKIHQHFCDHPLSAALRILHGWRSGSIAQGYSNMMLWHWKRSGSFGKCSPTAHTIIFGCINGGNLTRSHSSAAADFLHDLQARAGAILEHVSGSSRATRNLNSKLFRTIIEKIAIEITFFVVAKLFLSWMRRRKALLAKEYREAIWQEDEWLVICYSKPA